MPSKNKYPSEEQGEIDTIPFDTAQEAWFWFIQAQQAKNDGARFLSGQGLLRRPCEPIDFLKILDRLYRHRRLLREHFLVLRHYGRRQFGPDPRRTKEARAHMLWTQAFERMEPVLIRKKIIREPVTANHTGWMQSHDLFEGGVSL